jgi:hypothetical protein
MKSNFVSAERKMPWVSSAAASLPQGLKQVAIDNWQRKVVKRLEAGGFE